MRPWKNHYRYLEVHLWDFLAALGVDKAPYAGIITAHGDKCSQYKPTWEAAGLTFAQGTAIYLLTHILPFSKETRETSQGWINPGTWVVTNKDRFLPLLEKIEKEKTDLISKIIQTALATKPAEAKVTDGWTEEVLIAPGQTLSTQQIRELTPLWISPLCSDNPKFQIALDNAKAQILPE